MLLGVSAAKTLVGQYLMSFLALPVLGLRTLRRGAT